MFVWVSQEPARHGNSRMEASHTREANPSVLLSWSAPRGWQGTWTPTVGMNPDGGGYASYSHFFEVKVSDGRRVEHEDSNASKFLKENKVDWGFKKNSTSLSTHRDGFASFQETFTARGTLVLLGSARGSLSQIAGEAFLFWDGYFINSWQSISWLLK